MRAKKYRHSAPGSLTAEESERIDMKTTLEFILLTQSPGLFLSALVLLVCFFFLKKNHRIRAAINMIGAISCTILGIVLYYLGMLHEHFTIRDFWHIRVPGWVGLGIVVLLTVISAYRSTAKAIKKRRAEKFAARAEKERVQELEDAKAAAYESGRADAMAEEKAAAAATEPVEPAEPASTEPAAEEKG